MNTEDKGGRFAAGLLILCLVGIGLWLILAEHSRTPWEPFRHTAADFEGFHLPAGDWFWRVVAVGNDDPTAPNLVAWTGTPRDGAVTKVLVRLVHGYNMPMCMRIKGYRVELVRDERDAAGEREQIWRLVSDLNESFIWITRMVRAEDLTDTGHDIRELAFPRVGIPDDPHWVPQGLTWESFRNPWTNLRLSLRARWNGSRSDWRTFFKLRKPAWVSDEEFTLVATGVGRVTPEEEEREIAQIQSAQNEFLRAIRTYWRARPTDRREKKVAP
jgi:hypothetical protein